MIPEDIDVFGVSFCPHEYSGLLWHSVVYPEKFITLYTYITQLEPHFY